MQAAFLLGNAGIGTGADTVFSQSISSFSQVTVSNACSESYWSLAFTSDIPLAVQDNGGGMVMSAAAGFSIPTPARSASWSLAMSIKWTISPLAVSLVYTQQASTTTPWLLRVDQSQVCVLESLTTLACLPWTRTTGVYHQYVFSVSGSTWTISVDNAVVRPYPSPSPRLNGALVFSVPEGLSRTYSMACALVSSLAPTIPH